ncbi:hypothetical protein [Ornithinimicrobium sp. W1665]|uniref:hypothetical protein n=1 Tax=Ornithinimicrobium sp. W1665 TaxID=3416666 RepID=UPI003D6BE8B9
MMWLGDEESGDTSVINPSLLTTTAIVTGLVVTLGLGVMPSPLLDLAQSTATFLR